MNGAPMIDRVRRAWHALRGYQGAQDNRASLWRPAGSSATAEVGMAAAPIARRARDAVRNDPYAARIVDLWAGNAVGAGITTRQPQNVQLNCNDPTSSHPRAVQYS
jgi:capsid protein